MSLEDRHPVAIRPLFDLLESSPDAVFVTDRLNHIVAWNASAESLLGYSRDEAIGSGCPELMLGCDAWGNRYCRDSCPLLDMARRGEVVRHFDLKLRAKTGARVTVEVVILQVAAPSPQEFYLAHILKPSERGQPAQVDPDPPASNGRPGHPEVQDARARRLSQREVEILGLVAAGRTTPEIAGYLHISCLTVRNHIQNILEKLEVHSKAEAVAFAFQKGLV